MAYPFLPVNPCCTDVVLNSPCGCSSTITNSGCNNNDPCSTNLTASSTIVYNGPALSCTTAEPCDTLNVILQKIDEIICNLLTQINVLSNQINNVTTQILIIDSDITNIYNQLDVCCTTTTSTSSSTSTSTTTSTTTIHPCENFSLDNTGVDPVAIIITDCTTQEQSAIVLLPGDTNICVVTDSPLTVPGTVIVTPNGPCTPPTSSTTSTTSTSTSSTSSTTTTTTTAIPCECLTFNNTDSSAVDHNISYNNCNGEIVETTISANETLQYCGSEGFADSALVFITIGADCIGGLCPGISTTTTTSSSSTSTSTSTSSSTTSTTTTLYPCDCLTFENTDKFSAHTISYTDCLNFRVSDVNIIPNEIVQVCGSQAAVSDPSVTITVGGACVLGVCPITTTTTTTAACVQWIYDSTIIEPQSTVVTLEFTECGSGTPITITQPAGDFIQPFVFCSTSAPIIELGVLIADGPCIII